MTRKRNRKRLFKIRLRIGRKLSLFILLGMILFAYALIHYTVAVSKPLTEGNYAEQAQIAVRSIARMADGDKLLQYYQTGKTDAYYDELMQVLNAIKKDTKAAHLYIVYPREDSFVYLLDTEYEDRNEKIAKLGDVYPYGEFEYTYFLPDVQNRTASNGIMSAENDSISAWAPVFTSDGELAAMVELDFESLWVKTNIITYAVFYLYISLTGVAILTVATLLYTRHVVAKPMKRLEKEIAAYDGESVRERNYSLGTGDEIEKVYDTFYEMTIKMQKHIQDIAQMSAENERISSELSIAAQIQESVLPDVFPPFPDKKDIDLYALMHPAKEVGGDFYDFFLIDDNHLAVVVADVSGKGIPAALFMMVSKSFIKNEVLEGKHVDEVFCEVNNQLCENNKENFFVTAWLGILDLTSGALTYVNAGHNPPVILRRDGSVEWMRMQPGLVLAAMMDIPYSGNETRLERGDRLLLYTDGVTEAMNEQEEMYGEERLEQLLAGTSGMTVTETVKWLREDLRNFAGETQQYDDITILELEYREVK